MEQYKMPFLLIFSDVELAQLWSAYHEINRLVSAVQERSHCTIIDDEVRSGAYFRMHSIIDEMLKRETASNVRFELNHEDGTCTRLCQN